MSEDRRNSGSRGADRGRSPGARSVAGPSGHSATLPQVEPPAGAALGAYFTMEIALADSLPVFAGGLGVLAGDYLRSAADLGLPLVGMTLLYRQGYFRQSLDRAGRQRELPVDWAPEDVLERLPERVRVSIDGRDVVVRAWRLVLTGESGAEVPVYFLDTDVAPNEPTDRRLTDQLYGGDEGYRLRQEAVLGLGGTKMLRELGYRHLNTFHMNEGHSSLLTLRLLEEELAFGADLSPATIERVRRRCVFTTHTPVPAGHDRFPAALVVEVLGAARAALLDDLGCIRDGELNMSFLGLRMSRYANAVSRRHRSVARTMFPKFEVSSITNGVHAATWTAPPMRQLFDKVVPGWRLDSSLLRYLTQVPLPEIVEAHETSKRRLLDEVFMRTGTKLDVATLTIGLARRVTPYKQATLLFGDIERLTAITEALGPLQVVAAGKAHPKDDSGKLLIEQLVTTAEQLRGRVEVAFVENYDLELAGILCAGSDIWLNTPRRPLEASGTSGMKAALNGVPSLSILDGWWLEGHLEGWTGWAVGDDSDDEQGPGTAELYDKLEQVVIPLYYKQPDELADVRRHAIALNGSFFNTDRMAREYALLAYGWGPEAS